MKRRNFIQLTGTSLASLLVSNYIKAEGLSVTTIQMPDAVKILSGNDYLPMQSSDKQTWVYRDIIVRLKNNKDSIAVFIQSPILPLKEVQLSWTYTTSKEAKILGDAWERTYGDESFQPINTTKKLPWYCVTYNNNSTTCFGVKTGCSTFCYWRIAENNLELNLDTRSGGSGVLLGTRMLHAADIVTTKNDSKENAFATVHRFCKQMCDNPRTVKQPVYGINDWYFAYGNNSADLILQHTSLLAPLATNTSNKPFSVIDMGWAAGTDYSTPNEKFGDMHKLADKIKQLGMRPGIWTRPLWATGKESKKLLAPNFQNNNKNDGQTLDPTIEENIHHIKNMLGLYKQWGFEMVKHDYTTF